MQRAVPQCPPAPLFALVVLAIGFAAPACLAAGGVAGRVERLAPGATDRWICKGADGAFVSGHLRQADAQASCLSRAKAVDGGIFLVVPVSSYQPGASLDRPVVLKTRKCAGPGPCPAEISVSGIRGGWSWLAPTRLENGNLLTDLSHFAMYRQPFGGEPEVFAEINGKVTNLIWGMDTRYANACFWITAVRVNSAAMPSDTSNRICIDASGQPLPAT